MFTSSQPSSQLVFTSSQQLVFTSSQLVFTINILCTGIMGDVEKAFALIAKGNEGGADATRQYLEASLILAHASVETPSEVPTKALFAENAVEYLLKADKAVGLVGIMRKVGLETPVLTQMPSVPNQGSEPVSEPVSEPDSLSLEERLVRLKAGEEGGSLEERLERLKGGEEPPAVSELEARMAALGCNYKPGKPMAPASYENEVQTAEELIEMAVAEVNLEGGVAAVEGGGGMNGGMDGGMNGGMDDGPVISGETFGDIIASLAAATGEGVAGMESGEGGEGEGVGDIDPAILAAIGGVNNVLVEAAGKGDKSELAILLEKAKSMLSDIHVTTSI